MIWKAYPRHGVNLSPGCYSAAYSVLRQREIIAGPNLVIHPQFALPRHREPAQFPPGIERWPRRIRIVRIGQEVKDVQPDCMEPGEPQRIVECPIALL